MSADGSGRLLVYYQVPDGAIIENSFLDGRWTLDNHARVNTSIVTSAADAASALAAVSYLKEDKTYRQVFFTTAYGEVMTTWNTTTSDNVATSWFPPEKIIDDPAMAGSPALAACTGPEMGSVRVYSPSNDDQGYINEFSFDFSSETWSQGTSIEQGDPNSGVACNAYNYDDSDSWLINVYFRNEATQRMQQSYIYLGSSDPSWTEGPKVPLNQTILPGSDIAVCTDYNSTEYIFFQTAGGMITKTTIGPSKPSFGDFTALKGAAIGSKFAAAFIEDGASTSGAALTFQSPSTDTSMWLSQWSRNEAQLLEMAVT